MLSPYRALDLTDEGAMLAGQMLGDLGADVVLVEPPAGSMARTMQPFYKNERHPDRSLTFWSLNRNKRGITLDLDTKEGQERLRELAKTADFVFESKPPGYLDARGIGYRDLSAINPRLIMTSITPYGMQDAKSGWASADLVAWASSGAMNICGDDDRSPLGLAVPQAYLHAGAEAAAGALIAHFGRERDGAGQHIDVSAQTAAMISTQQTILSDGWADVPLKRLAGGVNFGGLPLKFVNPAKDGYVSVTFLFGSAIGPFTRRLMEVMCEEGIVDEATRDKDWIQYTTLLLSGQEPIPELLRCIQAVSQFTSSHTKAELAEMAMTRGLLIVPVATIEDVVKSPQLEARGYWQNVEHPELGATVTYPGAMAKFNDVELMTKRRPPLLGEHNAEVAAAPARAAAASASAPAKRDLPLAGVKVLEFMWVIAGPTSTRYLSDYGATVIKLESTGKVDTLRTISPFRDHVTGPERSAAYASVNAGKLGLTLNLKSPEGREVALKLAKWADIVTESFAPGAMKAFGFDYDSLKAINPGVIMISSCLNGQSGPQRDLAGFGTMGQQLAGFGGLAGWPDRPPAGAPGAYTDYIAPKFTVAAILAALDHRNRTGEGRYIDLSQSEASMHFLGPALLDYTVNGNVMERRGNVSPDFSPHGGYRAQGDDRWVAIVCTSDEQWQALAGIVGPTLSDDARFATLAGRLEHRDALDAALTAWTSERTVEDIEAALQAKGVPAHRVVTSTDAFADPQLAQRGHFVTVEHAECGAVPVENSRMVFSDTPCQVSTPGPTFGQHNQQVLTEIAGLTEEEFVELLAAGVLE